MNKPLYLFAVSAMLLSLTGCQEKLGGGSRSIVAGSSAKESVYGIRAGQELGFVIFTDHPSEGRASSAGSSWTGRLGGPDVQYEGDSNGLTINGTRYEFTDGRVFLVTTTGGTVSAKQLNIPIGSTQYDAEIDSISKRKEIQEFLVP